MGKDPFEELKKEKIEKGIERYGCRNSYCPHDQATELECSTCEASIPIYTKEKQIEDLKKDSKQ
ncbi:MAG: hypothetical protein WCO35_03965 [Candidatus Nomurabacteria bacterium]